MSHAQELITAIQTCIPGRLRAVIEQLDRLSDDEVKCLAPADRKWARKNHINDQLSGSLDISALHLAAKAYAAHSHDERLASAFDEMVGDLLAAGASPLLEMGARKRTQFVDGREIVVMVGGQTVAEVCEGKLPPTLKTWFAQHCDNTHSLQGFVEVKHSTTVRRHSAKLAEYRARKMERELAEEPVAQLEAEEGARETEQKWA